MSSRKSLSAMLGVVENAGTAAVVPKELITSTAQAVVPPAAPKATTPHAHKLDEEPVELIIQAPPIVTKAAKWLTFERKETRMRADQIKYVELKRKELNGVRAGEGERLTDNTLIRIAIDLLMQRGDELRGTTEKELRESLKIFLELEVPRL